MNEKILVTGAAGFIGYHTSERLLDEGCEVVGLDNLNDYYDVELKKARLARLGRHGGFRFVRADVADREGVKELFRSERFDRVVHLAAQAGVRHSIEAPHTYVDSNLVGFTNVLEGCRRTEVSHLVYASSSSVYGSNTRQPLSVRHGVDHPLSLYAATKKANEMMAHSYSSLYGIPTTGLRFFTVYGPWGRPDMALFKFVEAVLSGEPIDVYNRGEMWRDFTYIDDIVEGVYRTLLRIPAADAAWDAADPNPGSSDAPYRVFNIGSGRPVKLERFVDLIEEELGRPAQRRLLPMQPGDVVSTHADTTGLEAWVGYRPETSLEDGVSAFVEWYRAYYGEEGDLRPAAAAASVTPVS
jgi:UDP-glucuronate 4-epimerase